jgi:hypothetical protein
MSNEENDKRNKILSDLKKELIDKNTSIKSKYEPVAMGRQVPTPSFSLKPKIVIVKPKNDDEK